MRKQSRSALFLIVHPKVEGDLRILSDFRDASITGSPYTRETGFIGTYFGVNVFSSNNITTSSENTTVYNNLLLGPRALVLMDKNPANMEIDMGHAVDRAVTFHVTKDYGTSVLNSESIVLAKSA
jgi:hypothetical protein